MNKFSNPQHGLWATIRFTVLVLAVATILYLNAEHFDETEIKAILQVALLAGGYEGVMTWAKGGKDE